MMGKHLLFISEGFAPWGGPAALRATKLARCGLQRGQRVSVLTTALACRHVFDDPDLLTEVESAETLRVSDGTDYPLRSVVADQLGYYSVRIGDRLLGKSRTKWGADSVHAARQRWDNDRPDVIFATAPTHQVVLIGEKLSQAWDVPYVVDYRDPPWEIGMPAIDVERTLSNCTLASLNTPPAANYLRQQYPHFAYKIECWTNGIDEVSEACPSDHKVNLGKPLTIVYLGGLYPTLVEAAMLLKSSVDDGTCRLLIYGFRESKRQPQSKRLQTLGADLLDPIPHHEVCTTMKNADAVLAILPPRYDCRIPIKTYAAVASGRPVLFYGESSATRQICRTLKGIHFLGPATTRDKLDQALTCIANFSPTTAWPGRYQWLQSKTWPNIFASIFDRFL